MDPAKPLQHNLTADDCACLDRVLDRTPSALELAHACRECGWDVDQVIEALAEQLAIARKAKATFFPNRP